MTARKIANRLDKVDQIIKNDEYTNYHTYTYMKKIYKEQRELQKALYQVCA